MRMKTMMMTMTMIRMILTRSLRRPKNKKLRGKLRRPSGEKLNLRKPRRPHPRTIFVLLFVVFWDTSIPAKRSFWTRFVRPMFRREKPVVLPSRLVQLTSLQKPSRRKLRLWILRAKWSSRLRVCSSSTRLVTSLSRTSDLVDLRFVTSPFWSLISCTVLNPRRSSPSDCCETRRLLSSSH